MRRWSNMRYNGHLTNAVELGRYVQKMYRRYLPTFMAIFFLAGCSDDVPRGKIVSFLYPTFYLKLIDQDGQPIEGVETDIVHGSNFFYGSNTGRATYTSDSGGLIAIKVDSRQISFDRMAKEGYSINLPKILFEYYNTRSYRVPAQGDLWPADFEQYNEKVSPFIIKAWRIDDDERLAKCKNGLIKQFLNADGRAYGVDLLKSRNHIVVEGAQDRAIQIAFERENAAGFGSQNRNEIFRQRWRFSINVANGGLKEIEPEALYKKRPPRSGYSEDWELTNASFRVRRNEYGGGGYEDDRHFYLKLDDNYYARLSIRFDPIGTDRDHFQNGAITLDYSVNVDGSGFVRGIDEIGQIRQGTKRLWGGCVDDGPVTAKVL